MTNYGPYAAYAIEFDTGGHPVDPTQEAKALKYIDDPGNAVSEVFVISHGWNNDIAEARDLYHRFFNSFWRMAGAAGRAPRSCAVPAIFGHPRNSRMLP